MRRRELLLIGAAATAPVAFSRARAQKIPVIGILGLGWAEDPAVALNLKGLRRGLKDGGFREGDNVVFEYRWAHNDVAKLPALAADLVNRNVDVIVTEGGVSTAVAAKAATTTIPVVFHTGDAIKDGIVTNLAGAGGNLTGVSLFAPELLLKQLQFICDLVPQAKTIGALAILSNDISYFETSDVRAAAHLRGVTLEIIHAISDTELSAAYDNLAWIKSGLLVRANGTLVSKLVPLAAKYAVPCVYQQRAFPDGGGLASYGISLPDVYVVKGQDVAKILKGARVADLPIEQPTKFELVINLRTAKALGLTMPPSLLAQADEVIE